MALSVIQQPNGMFAVWSTTTDAFTVIDATAEDIERLWVEKAAERALVRADNVLARARGEQMPPPAYGLETCVMLCEANRPDDMLLPMVKAMLVDAKQREA